MLDFTAFSSSLVPSIFYSSTLCNEVVPSGLDYGFKYTIILPEDGINSSS